MSDCLSGLSPLARGTRAERIDNFAPLRFIPAGAGNTLRVVELSICDTVYPRWRGEHPMDPTFAVCVTGLSPLARGTQKDIRSPALPNRFIPAGAGNTSRCRSCSGSGPVYPRWRGEHAHCEYLSLYKPGLSPLARGTPAGFCSYIPPFRFIPAGVGNMLFATQHGNKPPVYPRWRGEHLRQRAALRLIRGLSPLARGTRAVSDKELTCYRFIPAGAGNTVNGCQCFSCVTVYPRWRGEHK